MKTPLWCSLACLLCFAGACGDGAGEAVDAGDGVSADGGMDAALARDAGPMMRGDAGQDAGSDSGVDAGQDSGVDAGAPRSDGGFSLACTLDEVTPIFECAQMECVSLPDVGLPDGGLSLEAGVPDASFELPDASLPDPAELASCILRSCWREVFSVSDDCRGCLLAGVSMDLGEVQMRCASGLPAAP